MSQTLSELNLNHVEKISSYRNEPNWLSQYRKDSLTTYGKLPTETSPLYNKYTDVQKMDPNQVALAPDTTDSVPTFLQKRLDELKGKANIVQIGTNIPRISLPDAMKSNGIIISSIEDAVTNNPDAVRQALESSNSQDDKFTALNNAAFNSGVFMLIPKGITVEEPIHMLSCLSEDGISTISRNIIQAGEGSRATIVQELYSPTSHVQQAYMELLNANIQANSHIDITTLQMMDQSSINFSTRRIDMAQDAKVNWYSGLFGALLSRYKTDYYLNGTGASANDSEVIFGNNEQNFDIQTNVNHQSPSTEGRVVEKSILRNRSKSLFKGMIRIKENATKSNSFLSGRSILLDKDAKSDAIPGLEIFTNDVKATHSASVAQIDEEQIFYLKTRCLNHEEAERTIIEGFLEPLSRKMSFQIRAWIAYLIESKWEGRELSINTDEELAKFVEVEETRYNEDAEMEQHYKYR